MNSFRRIIVMAEMHGRDLTRRHVALGLLIALPLSFYLAAGGSTTSAVTAGGVGMAFAVSGATLFSILSSMEVDQRLVLGGYRPVELLVGRLLFLGPLGLVISALFSLLMGLVSQPPHPWLMALGVAVVALQSVAFGLAVGAVVPRELEGTLVLIGVVGLQLAVDRSSVVSALLPFHGGQQLLAAGAGQGGGVLWPLVTTALYGLGLMIVARAFVAHRVDIHRPGGLGDAVPTSVGS